MSEDSGKTQLPIDLPAAQSGTMSAREAAQFLLAYAKKHRILNAIQDDDVSDEEYADPNFARSKLSFESQSVLDALRGRGINFIGFDEARRCVLVFTKKKVTRPLQKVLPSAVERQVNIEYHEGGIATVRGAPQDSSRAPPYAILHGKYYACGSSIYPANCIGAGTLGALARDAQGRLVGLTNNHVSAACNNAEPGLPILAPGPIDVRADGCDPFTIGRHSTLLPIHDGHPENIDVAENLDAAFFLIADETRVSSMQGEFYDTPVSVLPLEVGMRVEKVGRTTGHTTGEVLAVAAGPTPVGYEIIEYRVRKQVFFKDMHVFMVQNRDGGIFSDRGDSGPLVVTRDEQGNRHAVGLVFAGDQKHGISFILPIDKILEKLGISLVSGHNL